MADIRPFKGLRYHPRFLGELSRMVCPPFDTIPPELQRSLYQQSPYNAVRLEAGERASTDTPQDNRYTRAAALFKGWVEGQALVREEEPAFYLVQHTFKSQDSAWARLELIGCVRLEDYENRVVLPHEYTRDEDKRDRLALMEACNANFSPIMCLYRDAQRRLSRVYQRALSEPPLVDFSDIGEQGYRMWKIDDPGQTREIREAMSSRPLYIADGHHRYETALTYRDLMVSSGPGGAQAGDEAFNFVMMGLIDFDDPGLMVLPYHRVVGGLGDATLTQVRNELREFFGVEPFPGGDQLELEEFLGTIAWLGKDRPVIGLLDSSRGGAQLLVLRREVDLDAWGPIARSEAWILEEQVLRPILGDSLAQRVNYIHDGHEAEQGVRSGEYQLGFFLKPFPMGLFETIMNLGERLPPKSTFFYPKLATGLVINLLEGQL